jgi:rhodanese-related sulfurtransferase
MARISIQDLSALLESGSHATVLDARDTDRRARSGWIPGSIDVRDIAALQLNPDDEIVVYCDCPNDASAAVMVAQLREKGFTHVRPLAGGIDAWRAHGLPLDRDRPSKGIVRAPAKGSPTMG